MQYHDAQFLVGAVNLSHICLGPSHFNASECQFQTTQSSHGNPTCCWFPISPKHSFYLFALKLHKATRFALAVASSRHLVGWACIAPTLREHFVPTWHTEPMWQLNSDGVSANIPDPQRAWLLPRCQCWISHLSGESLGMENALEAR